MVMGGVLLLSLLLSLPHCLTLQRPQSAPRTAATPAFSIGQSAAQHLRHPQPPRSSCAFPNRRVELALRWNAMTGLRSRLRCNAAEREGAEEGGLFDMSELRRRIVTFREETEEEIIEVGSDEEMMQQKLEETKDVWLLVFNSGSDNEGVYSVKLDEYDAVLAFELEDDAAVFASRLVEQHMPLADAVMFATKDVEEFCNDCGYLMVLSSEGSDLRPPKKNVEQFDWQPNGGAVEETQVELTDEMKQMRNKLNKLFEKGGDEK